MTNQEIVTFYSILRQNPNVTGGAVRNGWLFINVKTESLAIGLAETIKEGGFQVKRNGRTIAFS